MALLAAITQGYASSQYNLGSLYETGRVLPKNPAKAAQLRLSMFYANGDGVARDFVVDYQWRLLQNSVLRPVR